jgi:hypothetical protein
LNRRKRATRTRCVSAQAKREEISSMQQTSRTATGRDILDPKTGPRAFAERYEIPVQRQSVQS